MDPGVKTLSAVEGDEGVICEELDLEVVRQARIRATNFRDRRPDLYKVMTTEMDELHPQ